MTTLTTYRWLARQLHSIHSGMPTYDRANQIWWTNKARAIVAAPRTIEGVIAATVNFDWMVESAIRSPRWRKDAEKVLALLNEDREWVENLPAKAA